MRRIFDILALPFRAIKARLVAVEAEREEMRRQGRCVDCHDQLDHDHDGDLDTCYTCKYAGF